VHFLLSLIEPRDADAVRGRLGIGEPEQHAAGRAARELERLSAPRSVLLWMLEEDDPATNHLVLHRSETPDPVKRDILRGASFGGARGSLPKAPCPDPFCSHGPPVIQVSLDEAIGELRKARTLGSARSAARAVHREDWAEVAEADRLESLPGYARWALIERIDCPPDVRTQFGTHAKFTHRLRQAGIVEPAQYVELARPPDEVLAVLHFGRVLFPRRVREAAAPLAPLVHAEVGANPDAWAVLAQLLPTFAGTVPELVRTSGAIAHV
jgi:hypothetical protein